MNISEINKGNKALEFIEKRISDDKYRGAHSSQHQRYTMNDTFYILLMLDKYAPDQSLMPIRTTDISKRPENNSDEFVYAKFCNEVTEIVKKGTQDAMRKLFFVDMNKMGFIKRYNKNKKECVDPFCRCLTKYVSITNFGLKFIKTKNLLNKYFIFSKAVDSLFIGRVDVILNLLINDAYKTTKISFDEYMFFVSAIEIDTNFNINLEKADYLINEYRKLSPIQRKSVVEKLRKELVPKKFTGNKINKRDFHNWQNQADQVFHLLNQSVYFEVRGIDNDVFTKKLVLKGQDKQIFSEISNRLERSVSEKYRYFKKHEVEKRSGFELHHVVPLSWSESIYHFKILDKWNNMVYIDAFSHAKITQNNNRNVVLDIVKNDIILTDYSDNKIYLKHNRNILYKPTNKKIIKKYNFELLNTIK
ncbi:hypothetical protein KAS41_01920 [Candidatus Parcubacteria bacterium]|nr:hypothetical protein [Candidatus Parcubacteria bacterium]